MSGQNDNFALGNEDGGESFTVVDEVDEDHVIDFTEDDINDIMTLQTQGVTTAGISPDIIKIEDVNSENGEGDDNQEKSRHEQDVKIESVKANDCIEKENAENLTEPESTAEQDETEISEELTVEETPGKENDGSIEVSEFNESALQEKNIHEESETCDESKVEEKEELEGAMTHPYMYLVETFEYPEDQLKVTHVEKRKTLQETQYFMITTRVALIKMLQNLRSAKEVSLDLQIAKNEYVGTVCLIQMSTKDTDYCIDALRLKNDLLMLTEIFINPQIVKIVVRAHTVLALFQHNFHLFMVNIFDVDAAKTALGDTLKNWSLTGLLKAEYDVDRGQLPSADFRQRPIPDEYKTFCRIGSHYLIYIYYDYKNKLIFKDQELYKKYLEQCRAACKVVHSDLSTMMYKSLEDELKNQQRCELEVLKKLFDWRANVGQKKNVKCQLVLHKNGLMNLVKQLPTETMDIWNLAQTPHVKQDVEKIKNIICSARKKFHIPEKKRNKKKPPQTAAKELAKQQNNQQKRKLSDQFATQNKQRRTEFPNKMSNNKQNEKFGKGQNKQRLIDSPSNKNRKNMRQAPFARPAENPIPPFLNQAQNSGFNFSNQCIDSMNMGNASHISPFSTFQSLSPPVMNNSGPNPNKFRQPIRGNGRDQEDILYRSLIDLKQARDNIRTQPRSFSDSQRYQDLNSIDQKINSLEKKVQQVQARNNYRNDNLYHRRRY